MDVKPRVTDLHPSPYNIKKRIQTARLHDFCTCTNTAQQSRQGYPQQ